MAKVPIPLDHEIARAIDELLYAAVQHRHDPDYFARTINLLRAHLSTSKKARQARRVTAQVGGKRGKGYRVSIDVSKIKENEG